MKDNDNHKQSDDELEAFLDGRHEVSRAYRELDKASPPRELDERILSRARAAAGKQERVARESVFKEPIFSRPYATAATVFLCLAITFLFINDPEVPTPADFRSQNESLRRAVPVTQEQEQEQGQEEEPSAIEQRQEADAVAVSTDTLEEEVATAQEAVSGNRTAEANEADIVGNAAGAAAPVRAESAENLLDLVEQRRLVETAEQRARSVASTALLTNPEFIYRIDREDWLQEIARLRTAGDTDSANREVELFLESYPGTDIDAALAELESPD